MVAFRRFNMVPVAILLFLTGAVLARGAFVFGFWCQQRSW